MFAETGIPTSAVADRFAADPRGPQPPPTPRHPQPRMSEAGITIATTTITIPHSTRVMVAPEPWWLP